MGTLGTALLMGVGGLIALMLAMQVFVRLKARAQWGKAVPQLPGPLGKHVAKGRRALVYLHSPGCAACRPLTPRLRELSKRSEGVYVVDVSEQLETARALAIMATPTFVEIEDGKISRYHVGQAPAELLSRYT